MAILSVNAGSSTLKFAVYPRQGQQVLDSVLAGKVEGLEPGGVPRLSWRWQGQLREEPLPAAADGFGAALERLRELLCQLPELPAIDAVAHRVVHGGPDFRRSVVVMPPVLRALEAFNSLAPLHQPANLRGVAAFAAAFPGLPQVACFDTAFHAGIPALEQRLALPQALHDQGLRRYGFHGLSYQYLMGVLQTCSTRADGRVLMAHLGSGASLCAALQGRSVASTMGFSALDGLMMGTRCGALDPGVLLYLLEQGWDHPRLQQLLYRESGLLGVSGVSADMRRLRADGGEPARLAIDLFTHRIVREAGAMLACLQGLDVLVFSGGIGENDSTLRAEVATRLAWVGVQIDAALNLAPTRGPAHAIHAQGSPIEVWVLATDEGRVAAADAALLLPH